MIRQRIRDTAILRFGTEGFGASLRGIAADAGVSAALVIHYFGSKEALRRECDAAVLAEIRDAKREAIDEAASGQSLIARFAAAEESGPQLCYVLRSLQEGGPVAKAFVDQMINDAVAYVRISVDAGLVHPSRDEPARIRYLTLSALGALLLELTLDPPQDPADVSAFVRDFLASSSAPMLELYSQGFFTTRRIFDDYLATLPNPPEPPTSDDRAASREMAADLPNDAETTDESDTRNG